MSAHDSLSNQRVLVGERAERYVALRKLGSKHGAGHRYHAVNRLTMRPICGLLAAKGWTDGEGEAVTCPTCIKKLDKSVPARTPTQRSWDRMKQRCNDPKHVKYHRYGGRGIRVCERWNNSFEAFLADMGERPPGMTLDRYPDPDGNYEPGNCRWATRKEQRHNWGSDTKYRLTNEQERNSP